MCISAQRSCNESCLELEVEDVNWGQTDRDTITGGSTVGEKEHTNMVQLLDMATTKIMASRREHERAHLRIDPNYGKNYSITIQWIS